MEKIYITPLSGRYASKEMNEVWAADSKYGTWRRLWVALAEIEKELGINNRRTNIRNESTCRRYRL